MVKGWARISGKKQDVIPFNEIVEKVKKAKLSLEHEAYFWILYYCGVRKSEGYERTVDDFVISKEFVSIDFHQRKKHGKTVPPLDLPLKWHGVKSIVEVVQKRKKACHKTVFRYIEKKRTPKRVKAIWVFPYINSTTAYNIVKKVLGIGWYPHFLRLNRLSIIGSDPNAGFLRISSVSGIKSMKAMERYLGVSKREQDKARQFVDEEYSIEKT